MEESKRKIKAMWIVILRVSWIIYIISFHSLSSVIFMLKNSRYENFNIINYLAIIIKDSEYEHSSNPNINNEDIK